MYMTNRITRLGTIPSSRQTAGGSSGDVRGEATYTTPGTYSWTCPEGVTSVCAVAIGAGAGARYYNVGGGAGLGWKNNIIVIPGESYTVVVGANPGTKNANGQDSYFINTSTVRGGGGSGYGSGGTFTGDGGGNGGSAGNRNYDSSGGGGAGGYSGNGGNGYSSSPTTSATGGAGGGGAGGARDVYSKASGGGTGIYGEGTSGSVTSGSGQAGSGGDSTDPSTTPVTTLYGGGRGKSASGANNGAVRIIWGQGRAFPSTDVGLTE